MKKQLIVIGTIIIFVAVGLCGCDQKSDAEKFTGNWNGTILLEGNDLTIYETYIFFSNNTVNFFSSYGNSSTNSSGVWNITDNRLILNLNGQIATTDYRFSNDDKTLLISDINGVDITLTKQ